MYIVGVTGPIDSGKTTFLDYLGSHFRTQTHMESSDLIMEVANDLRTANQGRPFPTVAEVALINEWLKPLPDILKHHTNRDVGFDAIEITEEKVRSEPELYTKLAEYLTKMHDRPELQTGFINTDNKDEHRAILQWLGGFMAKKVSGKIWYKELMRRAHEEPQPDITTVGGIRFQADVDCIKEKEGVVVEMVRPNTIAQDSSDVTERERSQITADVVVTNDGTLEQLQACASQFSKDLEAHSLKPSYVASTF